MHQWRDALSLAKSSLELDGYRLPNVARHLGISLDNHHDAGADALACATVVVEISTRSGKKTIGDLWATEKLRSSTRASTRLPETNSAADPRHILYGVTLTFSGELECFSRGEARAAAAALGATITASPTKKTEVIVLGGFDPSTFRTGMTVSAKVQKALDLRKSGQNIELISEADFIACLNYDPDLTH
jgi:DNA polymerase-3 subunit epsilon